MIDSLSDLTTQGWLGSLQQGDLIPCPDTISVLIMLIELSPRRIGIPSSELMVPGETYVGVAPGHSGLAFIRKRVTDSGRPPWFLTNIFGSSRRAYIVEGSRTNGMFCRSRWRDRHPFGYYPQGYQYTNRYHPEVAFARPGVINDTPLGPVAAKINQMCGGCGRYRYVRLNYFEVIRAYHPNKSSLFAKYNGTT